MSKNTNKPMMKGNPGGENQLARARAESRVGGGSRAYSNGYARIDFSKRRENNALAKA